MRVPVAALLAGVIGWSVVGGGCTKRPTPVPLPPPTVTVASPIVHDVVEWDEFTGRLEPLEMVEVRARVSGFIADDTFEEGSLVTETTELFKIDDRPFKVAVSKAEAELQRANAEFMYQTENVARVRGAVEASAASGKELEDATRDLLVAKAAVASATAALEEANLDLEWTVVKAPIAGRVSRKMVTKGNLVTGGPGQSTVLTSITSISPIYCVFDADERTVLKYKRLSREGYRESSREGRIPCYLQLADDEPYDKAGMIDFVDNRLDPSSGTIRYRAVFDNADRRLVPGLFARVRVPGSGVYSTLLVPDAAIGVDQDRRYITVVNAQGVIERREVVLGASFGRLRAIQKGVNPTDRVVINGLVRALPGAKVTVQQGAITVEKGDIVLPPEGDWLKRVPAPGSADQTKSAPAADPPPVGGAQPADGTPAAGGSAGGGS